MPHDTGYDWAFVVNQTTILNDHTSAVCRIQARSTWIPVTRRCTARCTRSFSPRMPSEHQHEEGNEDHTLEIDGWFDTKTPKHKKHHLWTRRNSFRLPSAPPPPPRPQLDSQHQRRTLEQVPRIEYSDIVFMSFFALAWPRSVDEIRQEDDVLVPRDTPGGDAAGRFLAYPPSEPKRTETPNRSSGGVSRGEIEDDSHTSTRSAGNRAEESRHYWHAVSNQEQDQTRSG